MGGREGEAFSSRAQGLGFRVEGGDRSKQEESRQEQRKQELLWRG